jgi:hypothetical protein
MINSTRHPRSLSRFFVALIAALVCVSAQAQTNFYNNITGFSGSAYAQGGAASNGSFFVTRTVADDLTFAPGSAGASITGFQFSVANFNTSAASVRPNIVFYSDNGAGGGPGTVLAAIAFNAVNVGAGSVSLFTFNPATTLFTVPTNGRIWAGIFFDNGGSSTATSAQMNNFGQGLFNPPTVGSSTDIFFQSSATGNTSSNPAGGFSNFGGNPPANFGWRLFGNAAVAAPETGSTALLLLLGCVGVMAAHRRLRSASAR